MIRCGVCDASFCSVESFDFHMANMHFWVQPLKELALGGAEKEQGASAPVHVQVASNVDQKSMAGTCSIKPLGGGGGGHGLSKVSECKDCQ